MATITLKVPDKELSIFEAYARDNNKSLSEIFLAMMLERLEDEYDQRIADEAYTDYIESGYKSTPMSDFWAELDAEV